MCAGYAKTGAVKQSRGARGNFIKEGAMVSEQDVQS